MEQCIEPDAGAWLTWKQITTPTPSAQTFLRCKSDRADKENRSKPDEKDDGRDIYAEIERGDMSLNERLEHMGINPAQYQTLKNSERKADKKFQKWMPKTKEEAQRKWQQMANTPDNTTLLEMFKKEGLDVLKEGK
jgi:small subunit ribosomal protein S10